MIASDWMITKHVCLAKNNVQIRGARNYRRPRSSIFAVHLLSPRPQSLKTTGKRKEMKRLLVITGMIAFLLFAANGLLAQAVTAGSQTAEQGTVTPGNQDNRRVTRVLVGGDSIVQAQPDTAGLCFFLFPPTEPQRSCAVQKAHHSNDGGGVPTEPRP